MAQSTNDVIPCAGKLTMMGLLPRLIEELERLQKAFSDKAVEFDDVVKMGRTQLQDAVPIRLGQSFEAYANVVGRDISRLKGLKKDLRALNIGATAVGTAINVNPVYLFQIIKNINLICGTDCYQADELFDATQKLDCFVHVSGALKTISQFSFRAHTYIYNVCPSVSAHTSFQKYVLQHPYQSMSYKLVSKNL